VSCRHGGRARAPHCRVRACGTAAWFSYNGPPGSYAGPLIAYRLPDAKSFGAAEQVPIATSPIAQLFTAMEPDGTAILAAASSFFPGGGQPGTKLAVRSPVGAFGVPQTVGDGAVLGALVPEPGGALSLISQAYAAGQPAGVTLTGRSAGGALSGPIALTTDSQTCAPTAVSSPAGDLLATWTHPCPSAPGSPNGAQLRLRRSASSGFDAPLSFDALDSDPALTGTGEGIVVFDRNQYSASSMAFEDLDRPVAPLPTALQIDARSLVLPRSGKLGLRVRCPVKCKVRPSGILITRAGLTASKHSKTSRLKAKKRVRVLVRFSRARVVRARRALLRGERVTLSYTVTTFGRSARALTQSRMVRVRAKR
jgi:hypothetical protein